jgi:hypothetical protein
MKTVAGSKVTLLPGTVVSSTRGTYNIVRKAYSVTVTHVTQDAIYWVTIPGFESWTAL